MLGTPGGVTPGTVKIRVPSQSVVREYNDGILTFECLTFDLHGPQIRLLY